VYADVNDVTQMRKVTAAGDSEEDNDFSKWTFTYTQDYQLIKQGENELTAKITCSDDGEFDLNPFPTGAQTTSSSSPLSEWHTVNVTAVQGADAVPSSSPSPHDTEEFDESGNDDEESGGVSSNDGGSNNESTDDGSNGLFD
jgi:hypothetical protein